MLDMPRDLPIHLYREITRHRRIAYYVRVGKQKRVRIRGEYGSAAFEAAYQAAITGIAPKVGGPKAGSLDWLVGLYRQSKTSGTQVKGWLNLSTATRRQRENILRHVLEASGHKPFTSITQSHIEQGRDRRSATPAQARHFVDTMKGLFRWAKSKHFVKADPTQGVTAAKPKTEGFPVWAPEEIEQFQKHWPRGTRERVMFDIFIYTGLRRGDAAKLGKQHVKDGIISITTEKTKTRVDIPMLPDLRATLDAGPVGDMVYIATKRGGPMRKESLGNYFREACVAAGINKSAHGLRKAAATHAAENGATVAELEAIFGWEGGKMAALYTRSANRKKLAAGAMAKVARRSEA
jgi:integrase